MDLGALSPYSSSFIGTTSRFTSQLGEDAPSPFSAPFFSSPTDDMRAAAVDLDAFSPTSPPPRSNEGERRIPLESTPTLSPSAGGVRAGVDLDAYSPNSPLTSISSPLQ